MQLARGILLPAAGALQEVSNRIMWVDLIAEHSHDLKLDLNIIMLDPKGYMQKMKQQCDEIEELLDKIDATNIKTNRTLEKLCNIYEFLLENPLRHYIPPERVFNNQTYPEYEAEFTIYYRMATVGASMKS